MAYLCISTHPAIFERPLSPDEAVANVDALLRRPHIRSVGEIDGFWEIYRRTTGGLVARGNLVPDAHLVSLLLQNGITTLWTHDRSFHRFEAIRIRDPFG